MFTIARTLARNKIIIAALLLAGYFMFAGNKEVPKPKSAWDTAASAQASTEAKDTGLTGKALKALNAGAKMAGVEEYMPAALQEKAVGGFNTAGTALDNVGKQQD